MFKVTFKNFFDEINKICNGEKIDNFKNKIQDIFNIGKILYIETPDGVRLGNASGATSAYVNFVSHIYGSYGEESLKSSGISITQGLKIEQNPKSKLIEGTQDRWVLPDYTVNSLMYKCTKCINGIDSDLLEKYYIIYDKDLSKNNKPLRESKINITWTDFYQEFADVLLTYKNKRTLLINKVKEVFQNIDLPMPTLEKDNNIVDIDPFTIFGTFNKGLKDENRFKIIKSIKSVFNIKADIPKDFNGIPLVNNMGATFYYFVDDRGKSDIDDLWNLFEVAIEYSNDMPLNEKYSKFNDLYNNVSKKKGIKSKLSMGLFWIRPFSYISLDSRNTQFLVANGISDNKYLNSATGNGSIYLNCCNDIRQLIMNNDDYSTFPELSYRAWLETKDTIDDGKIKECNPENKDEGEVMNYPKNTILYGPPGTGKTYMSAVYAVAIIENKSIDLVKAESYVDVFNRYNRYKAEGLIVFTTFHQSYGYEEFIEGIKPVINESNDGIGYTIEDGVFKSFCENAKMPENKIVDHNAKIWKVVLQSGNLVSSNTVKFECFNEGKIMYDWNTKEEHSGTYAFSQITHFQDRVNIGDVVVTYAGAGTDIDAIGIITGDAEYDEKKPSFRWSRSVEWLEINNVRNIKALNGDKYLDNDQLQHLKRVNIADLLKLVNPQSFTPNDKNYVFIIDEINRGNISKIFGELITLIEDTKRAGMAEEASAILPYSGKSFSVPSNVYILGTMNTADRSIALMDTALRRRFEFIEMMPDADVLRTIGADKIEDLDVAEMLEKINERITFLYDREHTIGHAFFTKLNKNNSIDTLKSIFEKSVIPLLQEYFYEDYQKIQLVLGDNGKSDDSIKFIVDTDVKVKDIFKGSVDDVIDLPEKKYSINTEAFTNIESYKQII